MDPPPSNSDYKEIIRMILGSSYIPIIPLLQGGGSSSSIGVRERSNSIVNGVICALLGVSLLLSPLSANY